MADAGLVGSSLELDIERVAHGGHCVARHEGRVVFVRHALPGERVRAVVTEGGSTSRFLRADAVEVLVAAAGRVEPPCPYARPGLCGGCDWQHADLGTQRSLKAAVVAEQLRRLAGVEREVVVEPVPGDVDGLGWRTRVRFAVTQDGRLGLRRHRSHDVVAVDRCRIAAPAIDDLGLDRQSWPGAESVEAVVSSAGQSMVLVSAEGRREPGPGRGWVRERAAGRDWRVSAGGFWQVHPGAAEALTEAVVEGLGPQVGDTALDLYAGVGLFAGTLARLVGLEGTVVAVESGTRACADARRNLHDLPGARIVAGSVERELPRLGVERADLVVLDPPRAGAGAGVVRAIAALTPRRVAYVACDPAALARDVAAFAAVGYGLGSLRAFDLFPMTAHVECVAVLAPAGSRSAP
jgi:tRNA/tmRNA/rRNA uracil-C5-methylase (TrmA/RlmC/RlmD family)